MIPEDLKPQPKGGRPASHSLFLTKEEYDWLQVQFRKRALNVALSKGPRKVQNAVISIDDKLAVPPPPLAGKYAVKMSREELQVLNMIVTNTVEALRGKIIPEYTDRAPDSPRMVEAMATLVLLLELKQKGDSVYDAGSLRRGNRRVQKR